MGQGVHASSKWTSGKYLSWWRNEVLGGDDTTGEMGEWVLSRKKVSERKIIKESAVSQSDESSETV